MNGGEALTWREVIDKHSASLVASLTDDLASWLDSELQKARDAAAAEHEALQAKAALDLEAAHSKAASDLDTALNEAAAAAAAQSAAARDKAIQDKAQADLEKEAARKQAARESTLSTAEFLNQAVRRFRQAASQAEVLAILLDSTASYCQSAVVLRVENNQVLSLGSRGLPDNQESFAFPLKDAPALAGVHANRDPLVALASPGELSDSLAQALSAGDPSRKAYLFPVVQRHEVVAILLAAGEPASPLLELLGEAAGMKLEALDAAVPAVLKTLPNPELVQIVPSAVPETAGAERIAWIDLSADDQRLHLQAQRVARVKVAEMRLYHAEELRKGVFNGDIYGALKSEIDAAREEFLKTFLAKSKTMVDYLHLEILRSLAHEDDRLLGHEYPGPMV